MSEPFFSFQSSNPSVLQTLGSPPPIDQAPAGGQDFWHLPSDNDAREKGYDGDDVPVDPNLPPGEGRYPVPHYTEFAQVVNLISRTYRYTFDEALRHSHTNALAIRRDPVVFDAVRARQMATAQLSWHIDPVDDTNPEHAHAATVVTQIIENIPRLQQLLMNLLDAIWYGRSGVQVVWYYDFTHGDKRLSIKRHTPINGDKLVFRFSGQPGVLVHTAYGRDSVPTDRGRAHFFTNGELYKGQPTERERECVILHQHEPEDADFYEGDKAGAIHGVGIRDRIYWLWFLRNQVLTWLMDYLERVGAGGLTIYYYDAANPDNLKAVKTIAENQWRNNAILFPTWRDIPKDSGPRVQRIEPSTAGASLLQTLITEYFDNIIQRYILGQSLSFETGSTGMGSGVAEFQASTLQRIIKYDAVNLQESLTEDVVKIIYKYTFPGLPAGRFLFDVDKPNAGDFAQAMKAFYEMGGSIDADEARAILGLSKPKEGADVLSQLQGMQPAAVGQPPMGVPQATPAGPGGGGQPQPTGQGEMEQVPNPETPSLLRRGGKRLKFQRETVQTLLQNIVRKYRDDNNLTHAPLPFITRPDNRAGVKHAATYEQLVSAPTEPAVQTAYGEMMRHVEQQADALKRAGFTWEMVDQHPYRNSTDMLNDLYRNKHIKVFRTGSPHVLLTNDQNDLFRAVHDILGHGTHGQSFGPKGEENAYREHAAMFPPSAIPALATETRGQNSWFNYGPHSGKPVTERPYAVQKAALFPDTGEND